MRRNVMPQDNISGAAANNWGHAMAQQVSKHLGASLSNNKNSNEAIWNDKKICIKSARQDNTLIGVTLAMLSRIDSIIAVIQNADGKYSIFEVSSTWYSSEMRIPHNQPRIGMVHCAKIRNLGRIISASVSL
jgi:hypothetical protein